MYTIYIDGNLLYKAGAEDEAQIALNVKPSLDIESSGSLSFVLPPGNAQYDNIRKMKSIITMVQDDTLIFRGRVLDEERDIYNQKTVYCEGDLSFLLDSLWEEQTVTGKVQDLFRQMIANHNAQVDEEKQFTVGIITAVDADELYDAEMRIETRRYWDTSTIIDERLLGIYGGYLRTRTEGGTTYIDWLKDFEEDSGQTIRFSVNLLDLKDKLDAGDVFTCLIPLGYSEIGDDGTYEDPVNIKSVNGGLEYIQDDDAVARYGKIWRSKTWGNTKDPAKLKQKAEEYLKTGAEIRTLTLKAVDMHFIDGDTSMLAIGKKVQIESDPHGISLSMVLAKMEPDTENPENTTFIFGVKPRTLSEAVIRNEKETSSLTGSSRGGGGSKSIQEEAQDILRWAKINVDETNANISLNAGEINKLTGRMSTAEIEIDGLNAEIILKASQTTVNELENRVTSTEIDIDGANANISLNAQSIDKVTGRVSSAEIEIDGLNSEITLKADKVYVDAQITTVKKLVADEIEALESSVLTDISESVMTGSITATSGVIGALTLGGDNVSKKTIPVVTQFTQASGESAPTTDYTFLTTNAGQDTTCTAGNGETVTF